jgi:hypothetical protein
MDHNAAYLLKHLRPERETVAECWRRMNVQRSVLQRIIELDYDELVNAGMRLHGATTSQAAKLSLHIEINGIRYSHISRYQPIEPSITCPHCGVPFADDLRFCPTCGEFVADMADEVEA